jgi:transposase
MRYLMLMWADADAASGDESDLQAWVDFDEQVKANGAFVLNGALAPASTDARLVQTAIAGHALDGAVQRRPYAEGNGRLRPSTSWICPTWTPPLSGPTDCQPTATLRWASPLSVETSPLRRSAMAEARRKFDEDFKQGAVRLVRETGKPIAQVARELGVNEGTLGNWCAQDRRRHGDGALSADEREELRQLRKENAELRMRCDVLKRSAALWVEDAMRR